PLIDDELINYIFNWYFNLMTIQEKAAYKSIMAEMKAKNIEGTRQAAMLRRNWISSDPIVKQLLVNGPDAFKLCVVQRLLQEYPKEIFLNCCPKCQALARTPQAQQCPKCFFDWHDDRSKEIQVSSD
ncbi:MAG TPA: hypothetical protein PLU80_00550, partial [Acidobacteriota bacterium]|nr:hypothetical protein [Acidobacteriota bacterium]